MFSVLDKSEKGWKKKVMSWILMACQPHRVTSGEQILFFLLSLYILQINFACSVYIWRRGKKEVCLLQDGWFARCPAEGVLPVRCERRMQKVLPWRALQQASLQEDHTEAHRWWVYRELTLLLLMPITIKKGSTRAPQDTLGLILFQIMTNKKHLIHLL